MSAWWDRTPDFSIVQQIATVATRARKEAWQTRLSFICMVLAFYTTGFPDLMPYFLTAFLLVETLTYCVDHRCIRHVETIRNLDVALYIAARLLSSTTYMSIGFAATQASSTALVMTGVVWMIGVLHYNSLNYSRIPILYSINFFPLSASILLFLSLISTRNLNATDPLEMIIPVLGGFLLLSTLHNQVRSQQRAEVELEAVRRAAESRLEALEFAATHDDLTGLLNRVAFNDRVSVRLEEAKTGKPFSLLLMDLDGFKPVNDGFGHAAGDALLREISARLVNTVGRNGYVARIGGDEFAVVLPKICDFDAIEDIALDLIRVVGLPVKHGEHDLSVGISIGITVSNETQDSVERLSAAADEALYQAKETHKSSFCLYTPKLSRKRVSLQDRAKIERAIKERVIRPFYQPKWRMADQKVIGLEALARWPDDPKQPSDSARFVAQIEELGLLGEFTYQMAKQVFSDIQTLIDSGFDPGQVSLNIPEITLATMNGLEDLEWLLAENEKVVPHVTLEITEDVFIARAGDRIRDNINQLRQLGVRISLDDFGTGFASFQHLRQLEFDELKIDTEFVQGLGVDPAAEVIVDGFLSIARGLNVTVVAEGVETREQQQYLLERGCPIGQGFLHSKAQPLNDVRKYLAPLDVKKVG